MTAVRLRAVEDADLEVLFEHQADPGAAAMAEFPSRDRDAFLAHWAKIRADASCVLRTITVGGEVAGQVGCWHQDGMRLLGYWIGRAYWGRGVATEALALMVAEVGTRPLHAYVALRNAGSIRVLEKCGFRRVEAGDEEYLYVLEA